MTKLLDALLWDIQRDSMVDMFQNIPKRKKVGLILGGIAGIALGTYFNGLYTSKYQDISREVPRIEELRQANSDLTALLRDSPTRVDALEKYKADPEFARRYDALHKTSVSLANDPKVVSGIKEQENIRLKQSGVIGVGASVGVVATLIGLIGMIPKRRHRGLAYGLGDTN